MRKRYYRAKLVCGDVVEYGSRVQFINSDGDICIGHVDRRRDNSLYFWNTTYDFKDYPTAIRIEQDLTVEFNVKRKTVNGRVIKQ